ncbi:cilia- and flagella-associated protein 100 isoform X1 [Alosa sapidissima]|uniref:cilia- and flagella-associated protein 100 isoform X1 n=1 Tax=Alosa sapidissima TaxID=34773 RepID=UPI001C0A2055|nr:cilia- and flagella-associated protein 100 isoform X1 [Alosa sapidissima]
MSSPQLSPVIHAGRQVMAVPSPRSSAKSLESEPVVRRKGTNPFRMPDNSSIFVLRNEERERRKKELEEQHRLKVHEKVTFAGRMRAGGARQRKKVLEEPQEDGDGDARPPGALKPAWMAAMMKDRNIDRESMSEYISKKREMFLMEYSLEVKKQEIERLETTATSMEKKLREAEHFLEEDSAMFDEFLKENDRKSVAAIKMAEQETKLKLEKVLEIKRLTAKIVAVKSDISKYEDNLKEYTLYKDFLFKLSPPEWQEQQRARRGRLQQARAKEREKDAEKAAVSKSPNRSSTGEKSATGQRGSLLSQGLPPVREAKRLPTPGSTELQSDKLGKASETDDDSSEYEDEPALYFTDPQQLVDLLTELEEQNLSLVQNACETEETLEEFRKVMEVTRKEMDSESAELEKQLEVMTSAIQREQEKVAELELRARLYSFGHLKNEDQDNMLHTLRGKVEEVHRCCVGDTGANLSTLQMLTNIESRLGELMERMETIPKDRLQMAEKAKERERRMRMREEKLHQQKQLQEDRIRKALERSQAENKKKVGKKLMTRSQPLSRKLNVIQKTDFSDKEREDHLFFFT